jgi:hypothetical protein
MSSEVTEALAKAQSAMARLVRTLAKTSDSFAYREAKSLSVLLIGLPASHR